LLDDYDGFLFLLCGQIITQQCDTSHTVICLILEAPAIGQLQ